MSGGDTAKMAQKNQRGMFSTRQLQLSIAVIAVVTLLGGTLLQAASQWVVLHYNLGPAFYGLILIAGYTSLILLLCAFFVYKFIGPFRRLENEMKFISSGDLTRRLSVRRGDDLHVRRFVVNLNSLLGDFEEMSREYNKINKVVDTKLVEIDEGLSSEIHDVSIVGKEIKMLQEEIHIMREKW